MRPVVVALFCCGLGISSAAAAQDRVGLNRDTGASSTPSDTRRTGDLSENGERLICRTLSDSSTSRMASRRVCRTAAEWRASRD